MCNACMNDRYKRRNVKGKERKREKVRKERERDVSRSNVVAACI